MRFILKKPDAPVLTERERTLDSLGMTRLREVEKTRGRVALATSSHQELNDNTDTPWQYSLDMWRRFLPKHRQLREYVLDSPPSDVLDELEQTALFQIYDRIEIWTPEHRTTPSDRMVIGVIAEQADTERYFRIAHWGSPHTTPAKVRAVLREIDRSKKRARLWKKHKAKVFVASGAVALALVIGAFIMMPKPVVESAPPPSPVVVDEAPAVPEEEPIVQPEGKDEVQTDSEDESSVDDLIMPAPGEIFDRMFALMMPIFSIALCIILVYIGIVVSVKFVAALRRGYW